MEPAQTDGNIIGDYYDEDFPSPLPFKSHEHLICQQCHVLQPMVTYYKTRFIRQFISVLSKPRIPTGRALLDPSRKCFKCRCEDILDLVLEEMTPTNPDITPWLKQSITARMEQCRIYLREKRAEEAEEAARKQERRQLEAEKKRQKKEIQVSVSRWEAANEDSPETGEPTGLENLVVEPVSRPQSGYEASGEATDDTGGE
ncbi:hypothetical protein V8F33_011009 [Rhypophila sp. PSN 637]